MGSVPTYRSGAQLLGDEALDHLLRRGGLRAGLGDPLVHAVLEDLERYIAAGRLERPDELLLRRRKHVVVERALHDEERPHADLLLALEDLQRIALVDRFPRIEEGLARLLQVLVRLAHRLLVARVGVAD